MEDCILNLQKAVQLTDDGHPYKPIYLGHLGLSQRTRFDHLGQLTDLEDSIFKLATKQFSLPRQGSNKATYLANLGISQQARFKRLGELIDIEDCISNLHRAVQFTNGGRPDNAACLR